MAAGYPIQVFSQRSLPVALEGAASVTVKVVGGDTVYYSTLGEYVTPSTNQGSVANGGSQVFTQQVWLRSGGASSVTLDYGSNAVNPELQANKDQPNGYAGLDAGGLLKVAEFPASGGVQSVAATDASVVVGGTGANPTVATGTLDAIATAHPPAAAVALNAKKITGLANGTAASDAAAFGQIPTTAAQVGALPSNDDLSAIAIANPAAAAVPLNAKKITGLANGTAAADAAAFGQIPAALPPNGAAGGDLSGTYPNPGVANLHGVAADAVTTKGDLLIANATPALKRLGVGSDGQVLTLDSAQTLGIKWASPTGGGPTYGRVTADIAATGSMANITDLSFAIGASEVWSFDALVYVDNPSANTFSWQVTGPASPTSVLFTVVAGSTMVEATAFSSLVAAGNSGTIVARLGGTIVNGANAGTVQVQFKESATPAGHAKLNSYLLAFKGS